MNHLANLYLAVEADLNIIPIINKIDLPSADPERVKQEVEDVIGSRPLSRKGLAFVELLNRASLIRRPILDHRESGN